MLAVKASWADGLYSSWLCVSGPCGRFDLSEVVRSAVDFKWRVTDAGHPISSEGEGYATRDAAKAAAEKRAGVVRIAEPEGE